MKERNGQIDSFPLKEVVNIQMDEQNTTHDRVMGQSIIEDTHFLEELFLDAIEGIIIADIKGNILKANTSACSILECAHQELEGVNFQQLKSIKNNHNPEREHEFFRTGALKNQFFIRLPNGKEKFIDYTCKSPSNEGYIIATFRDITEKYLMEKEVKESEQKFRRIFEDSMEGLILWNNQFRVIDINSAGEKMFGISKDRIIGRFVYEPFAKQEENKQLIIKHLEQVMYKGKIESSIIFLDQNGKRRYIECSSKQEIVEDINFTVFKDVTEKKEIEEQLRKSDTLNVIGELAAGIAHEIRNPMTALKGFIQLLESSIKEEHEMYYQVITSELGRIDSIINEFLILAKPQAIRFQEKDIITIMKETVELLNAQAVLHNVQFISQYEGQLPLVFCEPNQLKKVFINIIKNAIEVMPHGGTISITIKMSNHNQIQISIQDEGIGIPKDKLKKLGQPFYTTKERGTGLGLMVSFKIIEEHKGNIQIESEEGKGTIFHISLPLSR